MLPLTLANLKMMVRNRQTTFWALFFPLLMVVVFGTFDFGGFGEPSMAVVDQAGNDRSEALAERLAGLEFLRMQEGELSAAEGRGRVAQGELDYLVIIPPGFGEADAGGATASPAPSSGQVALVYDSSQGERTQLVEGAIQNLVAGVSVTSGPTLPPINSQGVTVRSASYFDSVLMGLVGMGIMTHSIISVAVKISTYRNQSILKRMLVTPLAIWKYFAAEVSAHLVLALFQAAIILAVGVFAFGANIGGNLLWVFVVVALGSLVFLNIGFILSAWANSPAGASGMGNVVALPMLFFAGTFFSTSTLPWILPQAVQALPLTPMLSALRDVGIEGLPLWQVWPQLAALAGWVAATSLIAIKVFRFS